MNPAPFHFLLLKVKSQLHREAEGVRPEIWGVALCMVTGSFLALVCFIQYRECSLGLHMARDSDRGAFFVSLSMSG